jgi:hypothetical protein
MKINKKDIIDPVIYKISHISSGKIYIGSALNFLGEFINVQNINLNKQ